MERGKFGRQAGGWRGAARVSPGGGMVAVRGAAQGGGVGTRVAFMRRQELRQGAGVGAGEGRQSAGGFLGVLLHLLNPYGVDI